MSSKPSDDAQGLEGLRASFTPGGNIYSDTSFIL